MCVCNSQVVAETKKSLEDLGLEQLDVMLLHHATCGGESSAESKEQAKSQERANSKASASFKANANSSSEASSGVDPCTIDAWKGTAPAVVRVRLRPRARCSATAPRVFVCDSYKLDRAQPKGYFF